MFSSYYVRELRIKTHSVLSQHLPHPFSETYPLYPTVHWVLKRKIGWRGSSFTGKIKDELNHSAWIDFLRKSIYRGKILILLVERLHFKFLSANTLASSR